jgi:hypothetical protein
MLVVAANGCQRPNRLVLTQPFAPPAQRQMALTSDWGWAGSSEAGGAAVLLQFPLPGAVNGFRAFHVYLSTPDAQGDFEIGRREAGGFLVQEVGDLKGKVVFESGSIRVRRPWLRPHRRRVDVDLAAGSGFRLSGAVDVSQGDIEIRGFARDFAGDVAALRGPAVASQPSEPVWSEETSRRVRDASAVESESDD